MFVRLRYLEYAGPVQSTYDQIVTNSLSLLRGMSLDERASKLRDQHNSKEVRSVPSNMFYFFKVIFNFVLVLITTHFDCSG